MAAILFLVWLVHSLIQYPQMVGDGLDEDTRLRVLLYAKYLEQQRIRLLQELQELQELEQATQEHRGGSWVATLWAALQQWPFWAVAAVLVLLLILFLLLHRRSCEPESSDRQKNSRSNMDKSASDEEVEITLASVQEDNSADGNGDGGSNAATTGEDNDGNEGMEGTEEATTGEEGDNVNVEDKKKEAGNEAEGSSASSNERDSVGNEEKEGNEDGNTGKINNENGVKDNTEAGNEGEGGNVDRNEDNSEAGHGGAKCSKGRNGDEVNASVKVQKNNGAGNQGETSDPNEDKKEDFASKLGRLLEERLPWPVVDLDRGRAEVSVLMDDFVRAFGHGSSNHFYPVLQQAIGVDSAFEGWSPRAEGAVYRVFVPLSAPVGHTFHLERDTRAKMPGRSFRVRVEVECTCVREQLGDSSMLCFLHHSKEELSRKQEPSLLDTLCTGPYLDVEKTARWLHRSVRADWLLLPQPYHRHLMLLPPSRSCKMQLSKGKESFVVEVLFGVRQGDSDVFVSNQPTPVHFMPSTTWHETYAVAEANFFRHVARQAPQDSWHCKCLQFLTCMAAGTGFSTYALKTVVMHLLNTRPLSQWGRRDFLKRMLDILDYLRCSLHKKRLDHFVVGNQRLPGEISLPPDLQRAEPPNLFQQLACHPDAQTEAVRDYFILHRQLRQLLLAAVKVWPNTQR